MPLLNMRLFFLFENDVNKISVLFPLRMRQLIFKCAKCKNSHALIFIKEKTNRLSIKVVFILLFEYYRLL